ncbi:MULTISPECIES: dihydropteroate synthase [unclassified Arthrobacter]|uniref:dihydropteroate synthase n=1 Tax=unclassified Arthrobacter TaxID=235627 RepID=UPI00159D5907|nr:MULTISPECIES: dihydropteroate synthase [unclassified Arthrobacter]MCQ9163073.1 dihydropteroate synthase [Arthrobacter sp. STN4]NVM97528.1 dihydropteroate synthase [Arthrobacter sp. SDTb3-6]
MTTLRPPAETTATAPGSGTAAPFYTPPLRHPVRRFGSRTLDFSRHVALMAIVNRTPDSFYDGGATFALDAAVAASLKAVDDGADWVDIGGVPFAPGPALGAREEGDRVVPVVEAVSAASDVIISVDTFLPEVAARSIAAGAHVINDTTGLANPELASVVAEAGAHLVITHSLARPRTVHPRPSYDDVVTEVAAFLRSKVELALSLGVPAEKIIIDPGHDLNKNTLHTLELTRRFNEIAELGFPALAAVSNKDFIGETLNQDKADRLEGSLASGVIAILGGARILRMHNVGSAASAIRMAEAVLGWRQPAYLLHNMGDVNRPAHPKDPHD